MRATIGVTACSRRETLSDDTPSQLELHNRKIILECVVAVRVPRKREQVVEYAGGVARAQSLVEFRFNKQQANQPTKNERAIADQE